MWGYETKVFTLLFNTLINISYYLLLGLATGLTGCNDLTSFGGSSSSSKFAGLDAVSLTDGGQLLLSWSAPKEKAARTFLINYTKLAELPASLAETRLSDRAPLSLAALDLEKEDTSLELQELASVRNENSYTFDEALELGRYYIFQVAETKNKISKRRLIIVKAELAPPVGWQVLATETGMSLVWERVQGASAYEISGLSAANVATRETAHTITP